MVTGRVAGRRNGRQVAELVLRGFFHGQVFPYFGTFQGGEVVEVDEVLPLQTLLVADLRLVEAEMGRCDWLLLLMLPCDWLLLMLPCDWLLLVLEVVVEAGRRRVGVAVLLLLGAGSG